MKNVTLRRHTADLGLPFAIPDNGFVVGVKLNPDATAEAVVATVTRTADEFGDVTTAPSDPAHVGQLLDHIAHLDDDQVTTIRDTLNEWARAAQAREADDE